MILICPLCASRYLIAASLFNDGPRRVRCARCSHSWMAELDEMAAPDAQAADLALPPEAAAPIPAGSNLPVIHKKGRLLTNWWLLSGAACLLVLLLMIGSLLIWRGELAKQWPSLESFYQRIGVPVYHAGDDLHIINVRSEQRYEEGIMRLVVEGKIANRTGDIQKIPAILAAATGPDGEVMQSWQIDPPAVTVGPGESVPFTSSITSPQGTVVQINLNFVEPKNDSQ